MKTIVVAIAARDFIRNHVMRNVFVIEYESGSKLCQSLCDRKVANGKFALCMGVGPKLLLYSCDPMAVLYLNHNAKRDGILNAFRTLHGK